MDNAAIDKPIEVVLGDGSVIRGASVEEAMQNAAKRVEDNQAAYREQKQRATELEAENARLREEVEQRQQVIAQQPTPANGAFDTERYYQLLNEDPIGAQNYVDQYRFGVSDPVAAFNSMREESWAVVQQNVASAFIATHPEWNPADTSALSGRVKACLQYGMPFNATTLEYAYESLKQDGGANPIDLTPPEPEPTPPPTLTGSSASSGFADVNPEQLSDSELEKFIRSRGMIR